MGDEGKPIAKTKISSSVCKMRPSQKSVGVGTKFNWHPSSKKMITAHYKNKIIRKLNHPNATATTSQ